MLVAFSSLQLPLEASIYWIQHGIMFVVPYYLLRLGGELLNKNKIRFFFDFVSLGAYNVEKFSDFSWTTLSYSINVIYHFLILQTIAIVRSNKIPTNCLHLLSFVHSQLKWTSIICCVRPFWIHSMVLITGSLRFFTRRSCVPCCVNCFVCCRRFS